MAATLPMRSIVVIPSIPGFGFSGPTGAPGWTSERIAAAWAELMRRLGYERYGAQGGDFGAFISAALGNAAPDNVVGVHVNAATYGFIPWGDVSEEELETFSDDEKARLVRLKPYWKRATATSRSRPPALRRSRTLCTTRRSASWPGSSTSSRSGPTRAATCRRRRSTAIGC